jgi:hypothetical protein
MKLYQWNRVNALKRYASGDIIVMAASVEEARAIVIREAGPMWARYRLDDCPLAIINEDDIDDWRVFRTKLALDLEAEPIVVASGAVFIWGSE